MSSELRRHAPAAEPQIGECAQLSDDNGFATDCHHMMDGTHGSGRAHQDRQSRPMHRTYGSAAEEAAHGRAQGLNSRTTVDQPSINNGQKAGAASKPAGDR
jgi:hypothetical protein